MKKYRGLFAIALAALCIFMFLPAVSWADVGNFNDYGGGGFDFGGGSSFDFGDSDYDYDDDYGSSGSDFAVPYVLGSMTGGGGSGGEGMGGILVTIVLVIFLLIALRMMAQRRRAGGARPMGAAQLPKDFTQQITVAIRRFDPNFSPDKFLAWAKEVFITLQTAWSERKWEKVRPFEKEELFKQHEQQINEYIKNKRINVMERININQAYLNKYVRDRDYEYLTVYLQARMTDYIKDEQTGAILQGDPQKPSYMQYLYTFMRKTGVLTEPGRSNLSTVQCPHCGAPTHVTSAGKCEYCGFIITTGDFDWVLADITGVKPSTVIDNTGVIINYDGDEKGAAVPPQGTNGGTTPP